MGRRKPNPLAVIREWSKEDEDPRFVRYRPGKVDVSATDALPRDNTPRDLSVRIGMRRPRTAMQAALLDQFGLEPGLDRATVAQAGYDPAIARKTLFPPLSRNPITDRLELTMPQVGYDLLRAIAAPEVARSGAYPDLPFDMQEEAANLAGNFSGAGVASRLAVKPVEGMVLGMAGGPRRVAEEGVDLGVKRAKELAVDGMSKEIQPSDVVRLLRSNNQDLFVRWSHGPKYDLAPNARSKDYQTGLFHDGLSANRLDPNDPYGVIARTLGEYEFHKTSPEVNAHIYSGKVLGRDSDNAFSIRPTEYLGKIPSEFFDDLRAGEATILGALEDVNRYSAALQNDPTSPHAGYWKKALETAKANLEAADPAARKMLQWFGLDAP